jgi:tetratricopeptide (TPR) repeat protein
LGLAYFSEAAVATYLARRFPGAMLPEGFARVLHRRTSGNPLFLVTMGDTLVQQGMLRSEETGWSFVGDLATVSAYIPETLRQLLEQHVAQLPAEEQALLEAASVAGVEFAVAAVAAAVDWSVEDIEERCAAFARRGQFMRVCGTDTWPDGTVASRYGFLHALYREILYERVPVGRRVRWHQQIGRRLEAGYEPQARERAAELAEHFVHGRDLVRAIKYLYFAGEQAGQRSAHQEALQHLTQGLELLATLPETPARIQQELDLLLALGSTLVNAKGPAAPEVGQTYTRALALCQQLGDIPQLVPTLLGLLWFYQNRGALQTARELGEQLLRLAQRAATPTSRLEPHAVLGGILSYLGEYTAAWRHLEQGIALSDMVVQRAFMFRQRMEPRVVCFDVAALTLWCLGYPAQAVQRSQEALALAQEPAHPYNLAYAHFWAAYLHHRRREVRGAGASRGPPGTGDHAGVPGLDGVWDILARLGPGHAGPRRGGPGADASRDGGRLGRRADAVAAILSAPVGGGHGACWPGGGGAAPGDGGPGGIGGQGAGRFLGRSISAPGRIATASGRPGCVPGRSLLPAGPGHCPPPTGQILGAARGDEPGPPVATAGQAR